MRRNRWDVRVGVHVQDRGPVGGQRRVPRRAELVRVVDGERAQAQARGERRVVDVGKHLRFGEFRRAAHRPHLPRHLVEVVVVQHGDDQAAVVPLLPVMPDRDQLGQSVHLHRPVACEHDDRPVGVRELGADAVGHSRAHCG